MSRMISNGVLSLFLVMILTACSSAMVLPADHDAERNTLLYDTFSDDRRFVIQQFDIASQTSSPWLEGEGHLSRPLRSPDRRRVAYFVWREMEEYFSLWIADADGQNARQLSHTLPCADGPMAAWSFDSRYVALRNTPGNHTSYTHILDTETGQEILFLGGSDFAWSPTALQLIIGGGDGIRLVDIPEGTERWLLNWEFATELYIAGPRVLNWLPDGQTIIFAAASKTKRGQTSIYAVDVDGDNFRNLIPDITQLPEKRISGIQVSPDGHYVLGMDSRQLLVLEIDSGKVRALARHLSGPIVWSPDSTRIVFGSYQDPTGGPRIRTWELFQVTIADGTITRLTYDGAAPVGVTW